MKRYFSPAVTMLIVLIVFTGCFKPNKTPENVRNYIEAVSDK